MVRRESDSAGTPSAIIGGLTQQVHTALAFEDSVYNLRREKLARIQALGHDPYPHKYEATHGIPQILREYSPKPAEELEAGRVEVRVAGRIMALRLMGKAAFLHLQENGQRLQLYVKKDAVGEKGFELFQLLDIGDHIGARGYLFRTRTGELTVHVDELTLLSKDLLPLPEKWHGLTDVELRYRQRYVDLIVNPEVREIFVKRSRLVQALRRFLDERGYVEVETPMMQPIPGGAAARPFVTHHNTLDIDLYLRIAPELYLKRLVVGGLERVYEINRNFRNEGISTQHNPEFTMLEFYQAYSDYRDLMDLTEEMLPWVAQQVNGSMVSTWREREIDWSKWQRLSMREAIIQYWPEAAGARPEMPDFASAESVGRLVQRLNAAHTPHMPYDPAAPAGKTIADMFEAVAEPHLFQPTMIYDFPVAISPLSKNKKDEPDWVERFEVFIGGLETGNALANSTIPRSSAPASSNSSGKKRAATRKPTPWTRTTSARSPTACLPPRAMVWGLIASPCF